MSDCPNAEMRDLLPDLLHERLDASLRAAVTAHVGACEDCRAELMLLEGVQRMLTKQTPRVDVTYVVGALPLASRKHAAGQPAARVAPQRRWADWRVAAAVAVLAVGGTSAALMERSNAIVIPGDTVQVVRSNPTPEPVQATPATVAGNPTPAPERAAAAQSTAHTRIRSTDTEQVATTANDGLGVGRSIGDMSQKQLRALLDDIGSMQAVPITEPEPVSLKVEGTRSSSEPEDL